MQRKWLLGRVTAGLPVQSDTSLTLQALALVSTQPPGQLLLRSVPSSRRQSVRLPVKPATAACCTWSPDSAQLLAVGQRSAVFVCARHALVLSQQEPAWLAEATSVAWGSAGLAAVHARVDNELGRLALCRVEGADSLPSLELLHLFGSSAFASNLSFSPSGLLVALAAHGRCEETDESIMSCRVRVTVYVGLSGETCPVDDFTRRRLELRQPEFVPPGVLLDGLGIKLAWTPNSSGLVICGHMRTIKQDAGLMPGRTHIQCEWPIRQVSFRPNESRSFWQSLPPLVAWYNPEQPLFPLNHAFFPGLQYGMLAMQTRWMIERGVWPFSRGWWPFTLLEACSDWLTVKHVMGLRIAISLGFVAFARLIGWLYNVDS